MFFDESLSNFVLLKSGNYSVMGGWGQIVGNRVTN